jgi:hypothetical protein
MPEFSEKGDALLPTSNALEFEVTGKHGPQIAWGPSANGLQAGLSARGRRFEAGRPMDFMVHVRNLAKRDIKFRRTKPWLFTFTPLTGGKRKPFGPYGEGIKLDAANTIGKGKIVRFPVRFTDTATRLEHPKGAGPAAIHYLGLPRLPPGRYSVTATCDERERKMITRPRPYWAGVLATAPMVIEVAAAQKKRGAWMDLLDTEAMKRAYAKRPGREQVFRGRLSSLRPITELRDYAYEVRLPTGKPLTLASGISSYLDVLAHATLASGIEVRGKLEKDVTLFKGRPGKATVLHPSALRTGPLMVFGELKHLPAGVKSREAWLGHRFKVMGVPVLPTADVTAEVLTKHVGKKVKVFGHWNAGRLWKPSDEPGAVHPRMPGLRRGGAVRKGYGLAASEIGVVEK